MFDCLFLLYVDAMQILTSAAATSTAKMANGVRTRPAAMNVSARKATD